MIIFHTVRYQNNPNYTQEELKKYINVEFFQSTTNWYKPYVNNTENIRYKARDCRNEDFGNSSVSKKLFEDWEGFRLYCPDVPEGQKLYLENAVGTMINSNIIF